MGRVRIGIIGCGYISSAYLSASKHFPILDVHAVADINPVFAEERGAEFGVQAVSVQSLLDDPSIELIVNLTIPKAHVNVGLQAIAAGKHVYSEKPLGITVAGATLLMDAGAAKRSRVGCAPDTFLGGAQQTCRKLVDEGAIGQIIAGTAFFMCPGHEEWHPNPAFYYESGGGPLLDMGPYYITSLVNLLGPIKRVTAVTSQLRSERTIKSEPLKGSKIPVKVPTHVAGTLEFTMGAIVTLVVSFDVIHHGHRPIELYGSEGSLSVPDPDKFGGQVEVTTSPGNWSPIVTEHAYSNDNYRILGVADMAHAIRSNQSHRASGELAFHVLEVMEALQLSSTRGMHVNIESRPSRPAAMPVNPRFGQFD
jgi:predicted dehydrogenase